MIWYFPGFQFFFFIYFSYIFKHFYMITLLIIYTYVCIKCKRYSNFVANGGGSYFRIGRGRGGLKAKISCQEKSHQKLFFPRRVLQNLTPALVVWYSSPPFPIHGVFSSEIWVSKILN